MVSKMPNKQFDTYFDTFNFFAPDDFMYIKKRGKRGTYTLRVVIPLEFRMYFPLSKNNSERAEYIRSLKATDLHNAKQERNRYLHLLSSAFAICQMDTLSIEAKKNEVITKLYSGRSSINPKSIRRKYSDIVVDYIKKNEPNWKNKTPGEVKNSLGLFQRLVGDINIDIISSSVISDYISKLRQLPVDYDKAGTSKTHLGNNTIHKHVRWLKSALVYAGIDQSVFLHNRVKMDETPANMQRDAFSIADIQLILNGLTYKKRVEFYWTPIIACLHGFRANEICQLSTNDIFQVDNIWCFDVNDDTEDKSLKKRRNRLLPVHPKLIELGLIRYKNSLPVDSQLFPALRPVKNNYAHYFSKRFGDKLNEIKESGLIIGNSKTFHSFRHAFVSYLNNKTQVKEHIISYLVGHANSQNMTRGRYTTTPSNEDLLQALQLNHCNILDWSHVEGVSPYFEKQKQSNVKIINYPPLQTNPLIS